MSPPHDPECKALRHAATACSPTHRLKSRMHARAWLPLRRGLPVGCYGGNAEIMSQISPDGPVYQAGTLSGNPVAMAAGIAQLTVLQGSGFYKTLNSRTSAFVAYVQRFADARNYPLRIQTAGSLFWLDRKSTRLNSSH